MKRQILILIILFVALEQVLGQIDSGTIYKRLKTKKFYSVNLLSQTTNGEETYEVNGKKVSKSIYNKYESTWKNMESCCPCILKYFDENDVLLREAVSCSDCGVGSFKIFYPNGTIKLIGRYKENTTGDWKNMWDRGYCNVAEGRWTYFNESGDTLYSEYWENGAFIKQIPEQKTNEIWKVELAINGESVENVILTPEQVKQLVITPKFKNSVKTEHNFTITVQVSAIGHKNYEKSFAFDQFNTIEVLNILSEAGIPSSKKPNFLVFLYDGDKTITSFYLNIKY